MGQSIDFEGTNKTLLGNGDSVRHMRIFNNGMLSISCWELSAEEKNEVMRSGQVFLSVFFGPTSPPVYVGSESMVRGLCADYGPVWKRATPEKYEPLAVCDKCGQPNVKGTEGLVLFFESKYDRENFIELFRTLKPNMKTIKV